MATFTKRKLSSSTDGKAILVAATSSPGTGIHTAVSGTADFDEIWIYAVNNSGSAVVLTIEFGGTGTQDVITVSLGSQVGLQLIVPGLLLQNGASVAAFADTTNVIGITGFVNRITA